MTDLYFTDRRVNLQGIATTSQSPIMWDNRNDSQLIDPDTGTSFRTLTGTLHYRRGQNAKIWAMAPEGNFVLYKDDLTGDSVFLEITDLSHDPLAGEHEFTASDAGVDLLDETVGAYKATKAMTIEDYLKLFTNDSGWVIGTNEISNLKRTLSWDGDDETALARIISVATQFDNAELSFRFDFDSVTRKVKKYIDVCKRRGADKTVTLYVGKELNNLVTNGTITDLYTSIKGTGGTPDGKDKPITLKGYKWKDPDGRFTLDPDDGILRDTVAVQQWSRALSNDDTHPTGHHIQRVKTYEATTQATLLQSELADLKVHNSPARTYEADVAYLPSGIEVGDTIHLANDDEEQYLQTRLLSLTQTDTGADATFGDFVLEESQLSPELQALADQLKQQTDSAVKKASKITFVRSDTEPDTTTLATGAVWERPAVVADDGTTTAAAVRQSWDGAGWSDSPVASAQVATVLSDKNIVGSTIENTDGTFRVDPDGTINGAMIILTPSIQDGNTYEGAMTAADGVIYEVTRANGEQSFVSTNWSSVQAQHVALDGTSTVAEIDSGTGTVQVLNLDKGLNTVSSMVIDGESMTALKGDSHMTMGLDSGLYAVHVNSDKSKNVYGIGPLGLQLQSISADNEVTSGVLDAWGLSRLNSIGTKLWSGAWAMADTTTLTLPKKISQCLNGIVLLWGAGNANGPGASDYTMTFIPKWFAADHSGRGIDCIVGNAGKNTFGIKYIYVTDTTLKGYDNNTSNEAANKVLQGVYEY